MSERLRPRDLAILAEESPTTPMHNATVEIFDPGESGFDYDRLVELIADRISFVPALPPAAPAGPRPAGQPRRGSTTTPSTSATTYAAPRCRARVRMDQLRELVARIASRPLDRSRPLWEMLLRRGPRATAGSRCCPRPTRCSSTASTRSTSARCCSTRRPTARPSGRRRLAPAAVRPARWRPTLHAVTDSLESPRTALDDHAAPTPSRSAARRSAVAVPGSARSANALAGRGPVHSTPVHRRLSQQRRFVDRAHRPRRLPQDPRGARRHRQRRHPRHRDRRAARLADDPRRVDGRDCGPSRPWCRCRSSTTSSRPTSLGTQITGHLVDLPIGEPSPVVRLHQVSYALPGAPGHRAHRLGPPALRDRRLRADDVPRARARGSRRPSCGGASTSRITNVPGPQFPLYAAGARMLETYPVHPLLPDHPLAIGVTSYDGRVFYGITADRDACPTSTSSGSASPRRSTSSKDSASRHQAASRPAAARRQPPKEQDVTCASTSRRRSPQLADDWAVDGPRVDRPPWSSPPTTARRASTPR